MTEQEILEEAEKRYPIGTKYFNLNLAGKVSQPDIHINDQPIRPNYPFSFRNTKSIDGERVIGIEGFGWVYSNKIWAEIISYPEGYNPTKDLLKELVIW